MYLGQVSRLFFVSKPKNSIPLQFWDVKESQLSEKRQRRWKFQRRDYQHPDDMSNAFLKCRDLETILWQCRHRFRKWPYSRASNRDLCNSPRRVHQTRLTCMRLKVLVKCFPRKYSTQPQKENRPCRAQNTSSRRIDWSHILVYSRGRTVTRVNVSNFYGSSVPMPRSTALVRQPLFDLDSSAHTIQGLHLYQFFAS
jgi:hypothetical protein